MFPIGPASAPRRPKLLDQLRRALRARHYSLRTEESYVNWVRRFVRHSGMRHPAELGGAEIGAYPRVRGVDEHRSPHDVP